MEDATLWAGWHAYSAFEEVRCVQFGTSSRKLEDLMVLQGGCLARSQAEGSLESMNEQGKLQKQT